MRVHTVPALVAALLLSGCGGSSTSGTSAPPSGSSASQSQAQSEESTVGTDAVGAPAKSLSDLNTETDSPLTAQAYVRSAFSVALGTCHSGEEFYSPDKNADVNSTETQYFYDSGCTLLARDIVRIFVSVGTSTEMITRTAKLYASGSSTPGAVRTDSVAILNAQFDKYGYPLPAVGYSRSATGELDLSGVKTIVSDDEIVMSPSSGTVNAFCGDSAGFNATGIAALGETTGWNGVLSNASRTVNTDGSITYDTTHIGTTYKGAIGSLAVVIGSQNIVCPLSAPMFTLGGGTMIDSYTIPVVVTFLHGAIENLAITNGKLANGDVLNVSTRTTLSFANSGFISGTIATASGTQVATLTLDAFGDGTLTVASTGKQFVITDWHVIR